MKAIFKKLVFLSSICFLFCFSSCNNFLSGDDVLGQLQQAIDYENSSNFTIYFNASDQSSGKLLTNSVKENVRVKDTIDIEFELTDGYKFISWQAVKRSDPSQLLNDYVSFENDSNLRTKVTITKSNPDILENELLIRPVAVKNCYFTENTYPQNNIKGVAKDSSIILEMTNPLSSTNDLSKIVIKIDGVEDVDVKKHFETPVIQGNLIKISAISSEQNRIEVAPGTTKEITVEIPDYFTYDTPAGPQKIGTTLIYQYIINSSTNDKASITFGSNKEIAGNFKINGQTNTSITQSYSIGEEVIINYQLEEGWKFENFNIGIENINIDSVLSFSEIPKEELDVYGETIKVVKGNILYYTSTNLSNIIFKLKILNFAEQVNITANTIEFPKKEIRVFTENGSVTPNGKETYKEGVPFKLNFTAYSDYCFTYWQVMLDGQPVNNNEYIQIDNIKSPETTARLVDSEKVRNETGELSIEPVCESRPIVISKTPNDTLTGVNKRTRIQIQFDQEMSEDSIYYNEDELKNISEANKIKAKIGTEEEREVVYAIKKNNVIYYKNITIIDSYTKQSLLEYFGVPFFESPEILVIPTNKDKTLSPGTQILVSITRNMYSKVDEEYDVSLTQAVKWPYIVNDSDDDTEPPTLNIIKVSSNANDLTPITTSLQSTNLSDKNFRNKIYLKDEILKIAASVNDTEPTNTITVNFNKVTDSVSFPLSSYSGTSLSAVSLPLTGFGQQRYLGSESSPYELDLSQYKDGIYKVYFTAQDTNNNQATTYDSTKSYYIMLDRTGPSKITYTKVPESTTGKITFNWDLTNVEKDYDSITKVKIGSSEYPVNSSENSTKKKTITGLTARAQSNNVTVYAKDIFDNERSSSFYQNTIPYPPAKISTLTTSAGTNTNTSKITIKWEKPTTIATYNGYNGVRVYYSENGDAFSSTKYKDFTGNVTQGVFDNLPKGKTYNFRLVTIDGEGNMSGSYSDTNGYVTGSRNTTPNDIDITKVTHTSTANSIKLNWTIPEKASQNGYNGVKIYYKKYGDSNWIEWKRITGSNVTSETITGLSAATTYSIWFYTYDGEGNSSSGVSFNRNTIPNGPAGITDLPSATDSESSVTLTWKKPTTTATLNGYNGVKVYKSTDNTNFTFVGDYNGNITSGTVTGLTAGTKYWFKLYTIDGEGNISSSSTTDWTIMKPKTVTNITKSSSATNSITFNWTNPAGAYSNVRIYYGTSSNPTAYYKDVTKGLTSATVTGLSSGTKYYYRFETISAYGTSSNKAKTTSDGTAGTQIAAPTSLSVYCDDGQGTVTLRWYNANSDILAGVNVYIDGVYKTCKTALTKSTYSTIVYTIPNYIRGAAYDIELDSYHGLNGSETKGPKIKYEYWNTTGNIRINGTSYSYSSLKNASTVSKTISKNTNYTWTSSDKGHYSVFNSNSNISTTISPYSIGTYEVTNQLYNAVMGTSKSGTGGTTAAVVNVTLQDAMLFCNKLSTKLGLSPYYQVYLNGTYKTDWTVGSSFTSWTYVSGSNGYRIPTAVEWEYAARGGIPGDTTSSTASYWTSYYAGANSTSDGETARNKVAVSGTSRYGSYSHQVGTKTENNLGLYDMSGNVWEWTTSHRWWENDSTYYVQRGGSWDNTTRCDVSAIAGEEEIDDSDSKTGFRICRSYTCN